MVSLVRNTEEFYFARPAAGVRLPRRSTVERENSARAGAVEGNRGYRDT